MSEKSDEAEPTIKSDKLLTDEEQLKEKHDVYIDDTSKLDSRTNLLLRKVLVIAFCISWVIVIITSSGLLLVHSPLLNPEKFQCTEPTFGNGTVYDNRTEIVTAVTGSNKNLLCNITDRGKTNNCVKWRRNNASIPRVDHVIGIKTTLHLGDLKTSDQGVYECIVCDNDDCSSSKSTKFDLQVKEQRAPISLLFDGPVTTNVRQGRNAYLYCYIDMDASEGTTIVWTKVKEDGSVHNLTSTDPSGTGQSHRILNVEETHAGYYTCEATTNEGLVTSKTAKLTIDDGWLQTRKKITIALGVIDGIALTVILSIIFKVWYDIKKKNFKRWMKKVIIVEHIADDGSGGLNVPIVRIDYVQTTGEFDGNEYQFQADENYEIPRENVSLANNILGEGNFGLVLMAEAKGIFGPDITSIVAVKKLKEPRNESDVTDFVKEMEVMKIIGKHENIINLLGCCSQDGELLVIVEYALHGCLQNYLRGLRPMNEDGIMERNPDDTDKYTRHFVKFGFQIARGMEYLASKKCVHRDLATRNVLIDGSYTMKISDFGLARNISSRDYYRKESDGALPVKWMAPESLNDNFYDSQSDVWSFGVLLWEIFAFAINPYPSIDSPEQLFQRLQTGYRMDRPLDCPEVVYMLMKDCWHYHPRSRPTFTRIATRLDELLMSTDTELLKAPSNILDMVFHSDRTDTPTVRKRRVGDGHMNKSYLISGIIAKKKNTSDDENDAVL